MNDAFEKSAKGEGWLDMTMRIRHVPGALVFALAMSIVSSAQTTGGGKVQRGPSSPIRPFVVLPAQSLGDVERKLRPDNKTEELIGGEGMELRVAVQHEKDKAAAAAELHDASDDVYYVLEGAATLTLGGRLDAPHEVEPGEWRGPRIIGGQTFEVVKGDLIVVPRGTPHMRSTVGKDFSMILIKVYAEPLPKPTPKPAPPTKSQKP
jgi:mannose-6-phosphate isomerase-like protein (cupin superfamily)